MAGEIILTVDLEGANRGIPLSGTKERLPMLVPQILKFLEIHKVTATFFVVGRVAETFPELIQGIVRQGHEIGLHTYDHQPLREMTPQSFREDLAKNLGVLQDVADSDIVGFRAPLFSLTPETIWALDILQEMGFLYDSSLMPCKHPFYGFPNGPQHPFRTAKGLWEIPMPIYSGPLRIQFPIAGGTYLRLFPFTFTRHAVRNYLDKKKEPLCVFFHPYDIDTEQHYVQHTPNWFFNQLMYIGRSKTLSRLQQMFRNHRVVSARQYIQSLEG